MMPWEKIAETKRAQREAAIPPDWKLPPRLVPDDRLNVIDVPHECGLMTSEELAITDADACDLLAKLLSRELTSHQVTLAFCKRAAIAHQLTNCLTEILFDVALEEAKKLDEEYACSGKPRGPLHGLPVSLKDCFLIQGVDATIGYTAYANQPVSQLEESEMTIIMRKSGAILFCKTNVPVALMAGETYNLIFGYTVNPFNRNLSSGGSSGGESALIAMRGSPLGVGTDVGGSIRIPASFCGLYSLKPSYGRFPTLGCRDGMLGQETVRSSNGPMSTSLAGIEMWCKAVLDQQPWLENDPDCLPIPWRQVVLPGRLFIGLMLEDGIVKPLPPVTRALMDVKAALEAQGHIVVPFKIDDPMYTDGLKNVFYRSACGQHISSVLAKTIEPWPRGYELLRDMAGPGSDGVKSSPPATVLDLWAAQAKRTSYAKEIVKAWAGSKKSNPDGREIDALLCPCTPWPASPKYGFTYDNYTSLWNVVDYCGTTIPVTTVSPTLDSKPEYRTRNSSEATVWDGYRVEAMIGSPVSIQLVGRRLNEEYLIRVTQVCATALRDYYAEKF